MSTADTWWSTVRLDTKSSSAISPFVSPFASSSSTSTWRLVSPAGFSRVAADGPLGTLLMPAARIRARSQDAHAGAPNLSSVESPSRIATSSPDHACAIAALNELPSSDHAPAAASQFPSSSN